MANQLFGNNLKTTLSLSTAPGSLTPAALVFTLVSGGGNNWPTPSVGDYTLVTLYEVNGLGLEINHEVVKVTNRTADTFTIATRDFETGNGGVGRSFPDIPANNPSGLVYAALRYTAYAAGNTLNKDDNLAGLVSAASARTNIGLGNVDNTSNATERAAVATLTNKTIALGSNTVSGTLAQFNAAVTDADLASLAGAETLTNKTIVAASNTITTAVSGNLTSTNLNAALAELQTDVDTRATSTALTTHTGASSGAHAASAISNTPAGNLAATDVQAALNELDTEKLALAGGTLTGTIAVTSNGLITISGNTPAGSQVVGINNAKSVQSTVTSRYIGNLSSLATQAAVFTLPSYVHYLAYQNPLGAGSVVTSQTGFAVDTTLIDAGTNLGFSGSIPAGTNRWNLYMAGTAQNYLAGKLGIGVTVPTQELDVNGNGLFSGSLLVKGTSGLGYTTGAGGTVTQATSKATAVTLNKPTGQITTNSASLAANTTVRFTVNNSICSTTDIPTVALAAGASSSSYQVTIDGVGAGGFSIAVRNITAGAIAEAIVLNFAIIKGATA